jgi:chromosome segregation ATPase
MGALTWRKAGVYVLVALPVLGLAGIAVAAKHQEASQQSGDPVADAARKAREQKKSEAKPKKVFTNDDVAPAPPPAPAATATTSTDGKTDAKEGDANAAKNGDAAAADPKTKAPDNSEAGWRKRFAEQHAKISQAEQELDILQRESTKLQTQYYTDPQKALAEQYTRKDITDQDAKIQAKKDEIAKLKQGLSDMEDQLRASGGDSGWAR